MKFAEQTRAGVIEFLLKVGSDPSSLDTKVETGPLCHRRAGDGPQAGPGDTGATFAPYTNQKLMYFNRSAANSV